MAHGHDEHGHGPHGAHDVAAGGLGVLDAVHGPAELPPEPAVRSISPAPEEYAQPFPGPGVAWPIVWLVVALGFLWSTSRWRGEVETPHHAHGEAAPHEAHE